MLTRSTAWIPGLQHPMAKMIRHHGLRRPLQDGRVIVHIHSGMCFMLESKRTGSWQMKLPSLVVFVHTVRLGDPAVANCCM